MSDNNSFIKALQKEFPSDKFQIIFDEDKEVYKITRPKNNETQDMAPLLCLEISIKNVDNNTSIIIKLITNCSIDKDSTIGRGTDTIQRIIRVAKGLKYDLLIENDVSRYSIHNIGFELRYIKILTTGETWYNALGFREKDYESNNECIRTFINQRQIGPWMVSQIQLKTKSLTVRRMNTRSMTQSKRIARSSRRKQGNQPLTVKEYYLKVVEEITRLSKKNELNSLEKYYLHFMSRKIDRKMQKLKEACPHTWTKFYDLKYFE